MIREGRVKAYKAGREWRILRSDIQAYLEGTSNEASFKIAAKGGQITEHDNYIIKKFASTGVSHFSFSDNNYSDFLTIGATDSPNPS